MITNVAELNNGINAAELKRMASGRWPDILERVAGIDSTLLDGKNHPCPKCGGKDRFRLIDPDAGAVLCNQCFRERTGDGLAAIGWMLGCNFPTTCRRVAEYLGVNGTGRENGNGQPSIVEEIARRKRVPLESWKAFGAIEAKRGNLTVCRLPMYDELGKQCGNFDLATINDRFLKGLIVKDDSHGLFLANGKLPKVGEEILLVEGPKDAAALYGLGFNAVGLPTSAMAEKFARLFRGVHVIVVPDRDEPGEAGAKKSNGRLTGVAATVRIATLPGELKESGGNDVRDLLAKPDGERLLRQAIDDAVEWEPKPREGMPSILDSEGRSDIANARRFVALHGRNVRYCHPWKSWLIWDGSRWKRDDDGSAIRLAKSVSDFIWNEARESGSDTATKFAAESARARSVSAILNLARCDVSILPNDLDAAPWLLNVQNGTVDLRTGKLRPHCRDDYQTLICPTAFNPDATSYEWDRFLDAVFDGKSDLIEFVQSWFGISLTGDVREQLLPIFWGTGANGKSTLLNAFMHALGSDFSMQAIPEMLMAKQNDSHPTERADLFRKRFVSAVETEKRRALAETTVKQLTGGDRIRARWMKKDFFEFAPTHKLVLCTNHKPRVKGDDHAIWRRLVLIPFEVKFWDEGKGETGPPDLKCDKSMEAKLKAEAEGILAWAVRACLRWQKEGLSIPMEVQAATETYREESDPLRDFITECCITGEEKWSKSSELREAYESYCEERGDRPVGGKAFTDSLTNHGGVPKARNAGRGWQGIGLLANDEQIPAVDAVSPDQPA